ncbi:MAG: hypothetical protein ACOX69_10700, partial [Coriobacteriales bacterium]
MGEQPVRKHIEPKDVVDQQRPLDASRAEPRHVVDHQGPLDTESASNVAGRGREIGCVAKKCGRG